MKSVHFGIAKDHDELMFACYFSDSPSFDRCYLLWDPKVLYQMWYGTPGLSQYDVYMHEQ